MVNRVDGVFAKNERVVIELNGSVLGDVCVVMVGAAGVGWSFVSVSLGVGRVIIFLPYLVVLASSLWVLQDARSLGITRRTGAGFFNMGPISWFLSCLLLWAVAFPAYDHASYVSGIELYVTTTFTRTWRNACARTASNLWKV